jgi:hypothetical protein
VRIVRQSQITQYILKLEHVTGLVTTDLFEMETHAYRVKPMHGIIVDGAHVAQVVEEVHNTVL